jgi:hypothetical protein
MKNTIKMMLVSAALAVPSMASAAECNLGDQNIKATPKAIGIKTPTSTGAEIIASIYNTDAYIGVKAVCSEAQVLTAFNRLNGSGLIALEQSFKVPVQIDPVARPEPVAATKEEAPVAQATTKPLVAPSPELREAQIKLDAAEKEKAVLTARAQAIAARAANTALPKEVRELSKEDRDLLNSLIVLKRDIIPALTDRVESLESRMTTVESDIDTLQGDVATVNNKLGEKANTKDVYTTAQIDQMFANFVGGIDGWFWWLVVIGVPLALLLHLRSAFAAFGRGVKGVWQDLHIREMFRREKPSDVVPFRTSEIEPEEESGILELGDAQKLKAA